MTEKAQFPGCLMNVVKMLDGRRKMEEFYDGRCKREEGRNSNAHYNPNYSTLFHLLYLMFLDLISYTL